MRHSKLLLLVLLVLAVTTPTLPQENAGKTKEQRTDKARKEKREKLLREMRQQVKPVKVYSVADDSRSLGKLSPKPVFRYSDQPRKILDGSLWSWTVDHRPIAFQKVEIHRWSGDKPPRVTWVFCTTSLSTDLIEVEWPNGRRFAATESGVKFRAFGDGPKASDTPNGRLRQIKGLARRFAVTIDTTGKGSKQEMRLLPRPVLRYADPDSGLEDGAVFNFSTNGTNPDALLIIELQHPKGKTSSWHYGFARMTIGGLWITLDEKEVLRLPYTGRSPGQFENWMWSYEKGRVDLK